MNQHEPLSPVPTLTDDGVQESLKLQGVLDETVETFTTIARGLATQRHEATLGCAAAVRVLREGLKTLSYPYTAMAEFERIAMTLTVEGHPASRALEAATSTLKDTLRAMHLEYDATSNPPVTAPE